jgi:hypothetical protein
VSQANKLILLLASAALIGCAGGAQSSTATTSQSVAAPTTQSAPTQTEPQTTTPETPAQAPSEAQPATPQDPTAQTAGFTDQQLRSFVEASSEVQPLTEGLASATPDVRQRNTAAISAALQRHGIDAETYNRIATTAQTDTALAARISALQAAQQPQDSTSATPPGGN